MSQKGRKDDQDFNQNRFKRKVSVVRTFLVVKTGFLWILKSLKVF